MCYPNNERRQARIRSMKTLAGGIVEMILEDKGCATTAVPGQFVNLYLKDRDLLLPRPISICEVTPETGEVRLVFAVVGEGTRRLAQLEAGASIDMMGPLGKGFPLEVKDHILLVGGGVGTPPLLEYAKQLSDLDQAPHIDIVLGFRDEPYLIEEFSRYGTVHIATDTGNHGIKGTVMSILKPGFIEGLDKPPFIAACGPRPMLKALQAYGIESGMEGVFSLEERMGCGFGGCVGCVVEIEGKGYQKVCKDGPVFPYEKVVLV